MLVSNAPDTCSTFPRGPKSEKEGDLNAMRGEDHASLRQPQLPTSCQYLKSYTPISTSRLKSVKCLVLLCLSLPPQRCRSRDDDALLDAGPVLALEQRRPQVRLDDFLRGGDGKRGREVIKFDTFP